ncbi:MAG: hypothetical protein RL754_1358 [Bacteroidota bacterium]|jgi:nucleoside-diphosphate-sugar epimerase
MDNHGTIFITGATGQLGAAALAVLLHHNTFTGAIVAAKRASSDFHTVRLVEQLYGLKPTFLSSHPRLHWCDLDLFDGLGAAEVLRGYCLRAGIAPVRSVIHAAAVIDLSPGSKVQNRNEALTDAVVELATELHVDQFSHISSIAVMGANAPLGHDITVEPSDFHPFRGAKELGRYAKSKMASELRVWRAKEEGLRVSVFRPGVILGVGPASRAPQELWLRLWKRKLPFATDGLTGVVDVRDVAAAVVAGHWAQVEGPVVLVGHNLQFDVMLRGLSQGLGVKREFKMLSRRPWLNRMRAFSFLRFIPGIGHFFTAQMRSMLFSRMSFNGQSGAEVMERAYTSFEESTRVLGGLMREELARESKS